MQATKERHPLWSKSQLRYLEGAGAAAADSDSPGPVKRALASAGKGPGRGIAGEGLLTAEVLDKLGLRHLANLSTDPGMLAQMLEADDRADGRTDSDEFSRGIRRAVRLDVAFRAKLHERAGQTWKAWISEHFQAGYTSYRRYRVAAELQIGLARRGLPLLVSNYQSRALAPLRRHAEFWTALESGFLKDGFPERGALRSGLEQALGVHPLRRATARIRLQRRLRRAVAEVGTNEADPTVGQAVAWVAKALSLLEEGGAG